MAYCAYVTTLKNVRKHPNADRLLLAECFGNTVCVSTDYEEGQIGVYFPTDGQLSVEFAEKNNLLRKKDENGNNVGGYMDPDKRNVTSIRLRGEKSDGLFLPMSCLDYCFDNGAVGHMNIGDIVTVVNGHEICQKYIPKGKKSGTTAVTGNKTRKKKEPIAPLFAEHADTEQLAYNLSAFKAGDQIEITLKMHGTSQRTGYLPVLKEYAGPKWALDVISCRGLYRFVKPSQKRIDAAEKVLTPMYDYDYITGTRRTVLDNFDGGFYGSNEFREQHAEVFRNKLWKGETVYYEVVGFTHTGAPIMSTADNSKLGKEFVKQYGKTTTFSYGCDADGELKSDCYVYRMTMTNEDGEVVEYTPDFMRYRCEQMGVKTVPVFWKGYIPFEEQLKQIPLSRNNGEALLFGVTTPGDFIKEKAEQFYDGADPVGKTHVREGVVVRIINRPKFAAYKHKNFSFKVLEGIIKDTAEAPDMEEADGLEVENGEG